VLRKSSDENCLIALFTGKAEVALRKCRRVLLGDFEPVWVRSPNAKYWVYSLRKPIHVTLKCRPLGDSALEDDETADVWLSGNVFCQTPRHAMYMAKHLSCYPFVRKNCGGIK
jgi:hypothetical protein